MDEASRKLTDSKIAPSVAVIMPAYNEADGIEQVVREWHEVLARIPGSALVVLNDGSRDGTAEVLARLEPQIPGLHVINKPNSGHGSTCLAGYNWAIEHGFEYVFQTDSDGQTLPDEFHRVWRNRGNRDFIFGRRRTRGDGLGRMVISRVLRLSIFALSRRWVPDANVPFRLMRCTALKPLLPRIPRDFFLANALLTCEIVSHHPIQWERITFKPRFGGMASVRMLGFARRGAQFVRQFREYRRQAPLAPPVLSAESSPRREPV